jgi:flagellar L-ring protein FlgH
VLKQLKFVYKLSLCVIASSLLFTSYIYADSLWNASPQESLYSAHKKLIRVGDIITIYITESTSAVQEASTKTGKQSQLSTDLINNWDQVANLLGNESIRKRHEFELSGEDQFLGSGQTTRKSRLKAVVSAVVTEILETGNIFVVGEHQIKVNNEIETIRISGIIRPEDIRPDNSIDSQQVAKKEVSVIGAGVVGSKQTPGIMTKMFNWLF